MKVVSFNIRCQAADDGLNSWVHRAPAAVQALRDLKPDLICLQEAFWDQLMAVADAFPDFAWEAVGREDGQRGGETCAVLWRADGFEKTDSGTFWLSDRPDEPGSMSWWTACTRICTWVDLQGPSGPFRLASTHWDHVSIPARRGASRLIADRFQDVRSLILCGDFNEGPKSRKLPYPLLTPGLHATFHGYREKAFGPPIDGIYGLGFEASASGIDPSRPEGQWPSDHYPVWAEVSKQLS